MSDPAHILIVDDEPNVCFTLERTLQKEKYLVDTATNGREALAKIGRATYDLILLDLRMQPIPGIQVLQAVHAKDPSTVVIILTGHSTVETAVEALRLGAFDYLFKPVSPDTILQRVREGLAHRNDERRRSHVLQQVDTLSETLLSLHMESERLQQSSTSNRFLSSGTLTIDLHKRSAALRGRLLDLTTAEFNILLCLVQQAPKEVSPRQLVNQALGYDAEYTQAAEIMKYHIHQLRRKIGDDPQHPHLIKTVRYQGYLWSND